MRRPVVGDELPPLELPPLTRATLALYAGGSGDHIPLHIDTDFARAAGHRDVFMHGMLGVAYIARVLTEWTPQESLRDLSVRFTAITYPGESLVASATVGGIDVIESDGAEELQVQLDVQLRNTSGDVKIVGSATIARTAATYE
jgi:acyl dehydratase